MILISEINLTPNKSHVTRYWLIFPWRPCIYQWTGC